MLLGMIVGIDLNKAIGHNGQLLYSVKEDLKHFKKLTEHRTIIMGRKTFFSLPKGKPLPNRQHLILSKSAYEVEEGYSDVCKSFYSKDEVLFFLEKNNSSNKNISNENDKNNSLINLTEDIFDINSILNLDAYIIGGAEIYKLFLNDVDVLEITEFITEAEQADTYFPEFQNDFIEICATKISEASAFNHITQAEENIKYQFKRYLRRELYYEFYKSDQ